MGAWCVVICFLCLMFLQETKGVTVDLADYKGGAVTVRVPRMEITDAQAREKERGKERGGGLIERGWGSGDAEI